MIPSSNQRFRSGMLENEVHRPCQCPNHHNQDASINHKGDPVVVEPFSTIIDGYKIHPHNKKYIQGGDESIKPSSQIMVTAEDLRHNKYQYVGNCHTHHYQIKER